jgi:hypothetical protein
MAEFERRLLPRFVARPLASTTVRDAMIIDWAHVAPTIVAAFLASLVEFVEALTVVLAVGAVRGWRSALGGASVALLLLALLVAVLGPAEHRGGRGL